MNPRLIVIAVLALTCQVVAAAPPKKLFDVTLEDVHSGARVLSVSFYRTQPPPSAVDKILRQSLEHAVLIDGSRTILAMAFVGNDNLSRNQYSGPLVYDSRAKKIVTADEHRGVKKTTVTNSAYLVEIEEGKTLGGITPAKKWLTLEIVFPSQPAREAAYNVMNVEVGKLVGRGLDINVYVNAGDPKVKTSWKQVRDRDGAFIFADCDAGSKKLMRKGHLLKQFP